MVLILPSAYLAILLAVVALRPNWGWRRSALRSAVVWGFYSVVTTEVLNFRSMITPVRLLIAWLILLVVCLLVIGLTSRSGRIPRIRFHRPALDPIMSGLFLFIAIPCFVTAVVASRAPPQTWDSLNYHLPRVAHWAQQASVAHFATGIEVQNSRPPAAEFAVLHTYLLAGGDRYVNFVQWSAMLISVVGATLLAEQLGAGRRGQLLAAVFAATLPMGIVQASSTTTDYLVALWVLAAASETLTLRERGLSPAIMIFLGLAAALGLATKPTAAAYLVPIGAYAAYLLFGRHRSLVAVRWAAVAAGLVILVNAGHLGRNLVTYGSLFDPAQVAIHNNQLRDPRGVISNVLRHAGLEAGTPSPHINKALALGVQWVHRLMGLDVNDPRTTAHGVFKISLPTTNEDRAGNPLHAYLIVALLVDLLARRQSLARPQQLLLALLALSVLVFSYMFKWQIFASRYHLPWFVLAAAFAGTRLERAFNPTVLLAAGTAMLLSAWPWMFQIRSRPLIPKAGESYVDSIFREPREELYLANGLHLLGPYLEFTRQLKGAGCQEIGIALPGTAAEYPLWVFLGAPDPGLRIEWLVAGTPSAQYAVQDFQPCGVICEGCSEDQMEMWGLPLVESRGELRLFAESASASLWKVESSRGALGPGS